MADVVFTDLSPNSGLQGTLFQGKKFWLSQKVPQRSRFITDIKVLPRQLDIAIISTDFCAGQWRRCTAGGKVRRYQNCGSCKERGTAGNVRDSSSLRLISIN